MPSDLLPPKGQPMNGQRSFPLVHKITLGLWVVTAAGTGLLLWLLSRGDGDAWLPLWVLLIGVTGYLHCMGLVRLTGMVRSRSRATMWLVLGAGVLSATLTQGAIDHMVWDYFMRMTHPKFRSDWAGGIGFNVMMYIWLFASYEAVLLLMSSTEASLKQARQIAFAEEAARKAAFQKSRYQMNPRFLASTFEHLWMLLEQEQAVEAEATLQRFSEYLRWILTTSEDGTAAAGDEIAAVESYLAVAGRKGGRLEIDCPDDFLESRIPAFLLQALIDCLPTNKAGATVTTIKIDRAGSDAHIEVMGSPGDHEPPSDQIARLDLVRQNFAGEGVWLNIRAAWHLQARVQLPTA